MKVNGPVEIYKEIRAERDALRDKIFTAENIAYRAEHRALSISVHTQQSEKLLPQ